MKIAVASDQGMVTGHFGHCESFYIFQSEDKKIVSSECIANPGHKPGFLPNFLNDLGINVIISGGMGAGAVNMFKEKGIDVIVGIKGEAKETAALYLSGNLESVGSVCQEHQHDPNHQGGCGQ